MSNRSSTFAIVAVVVLALSAGIVLSAYLLSRFMIRIQNVRENTITVKGVAERTVRSDVASFYCTVSVKDANMAAGYEALNRARAVLGGKLLQLGFPPEVREDEEINSYELLKTVKTTVNGKTTSEEVSDGYKFSYQVRIRTRDVELVKRAIELYELSGQGMEVSVTQPEYFISNPEQYKLELVDAASQAATQRAQVVAEKCGSRIGKLLTARQGVIQITRPASSETSDYGVYDTRSLEKNIRIVMTLDFVLD